MKSAANVFREGDVIYGRLRPYLNKVYQSDFDGLCSSEFIVMPETSATHGRFLKYRLNSSDFVKFSSSLNTGDRPRVDFHQIGEFPFRLPPRKEQSRIADALDELFSDLDAGVAALERAREKLNLYRASVLKAAVEGSLTAEWRRRNPQAEPSDELLKRILVERRRRWEKDQIRKFREKRRTLPRNWKARYKEPVAPDVAELPALPEGWCWATVDQCSSLIQYGTSAKTNQDSAGVPILRMGNITVHGSLLLDSLRYLPSDHGEFPDLLLEPSDLLFNRTNSAELVGKTAMYLGKPSPCSFASYLIRVRLLEGANPFLVVCALNGGIGRTWIARVANQTVGQANVNGTKLAAFSFPLPPTNEQDAIIEAIEDQLSTIEHLEADIEAKLESAQALRQAILKHAFSGKLVPQDPNDEPAFELLERIAAEREAREEEAASAKRPAGAAGKARRRRRSRTSQRRGSIDFDKLETEPRRLGIKGAEERRPKEFDDPTFSRRVPGLEEEE